MTTTLIIDADSLAYLHAASSEERFDFGDDLVSTTQRLTVDEVCERVERDIKQWQKRLNADNVVITLSCASRDCWRCDVLPSYKANRVNVKPEMLGDAKAFLRGNYKTYERPRMEADDICGILATHPTLVHGDVIIVSIDKDLKTIPGTLYNPQTRQLHNIDALEADYWHMYQTLVGDSTDGYKGCPGIGPVKATKLLHAPNGEQYGEWSMWQAVVAAFESKGLTEADALVQARVARICRADDYNFKTKEVKLWSPATS